MPNENFLQAAFRHAKDANILYDQQCYDNAMYHYGFAAECTIKEIAHRFGISHTNDLKKHYSHQINALLLDEQFVDIMDDQFIAFLSPALLLGIDALHVPPILINGHPERRYFPDDSYTQVDCQQVQPYIQDMMNFLTRELLDAGELEGIFRVISFDDVLQRLEGTLIHWGYCTNVSSITVIRDIYGRISLFLEGNSNQFAGYLEPLKSKCAQDLGNYWGGSVLYQKQNLKPIQSNVIQAIQSERSPYLPQSPALQSLQMYCLERTVAKKAWMLSQSADTAPWSYNDANSGSAPKIVSFYSFKGGMGRTTAMAGVGLLLAKEGKKVILVDTDVEAPGLASLFFPSSIIECGVLDYFLDKNVGSMDSIQNYVYEYDLTQVLDDSEDGNGKLSIVPAGVVNSEYLVKLARIDLQEYKKNSLRESMTNLLNDLRTAFPDTDYILIDARAGFHDLGGVALGQIPHGAVLFGNDSDQSWSGMAQAIHFVAQTQTDTMFLIMAASMSEPRSSEKYGERLSAFAKRSHELFCGTYYTDLIPGIDAEDAAHYPIAVEFNRSLQQNIHLYPIDGIAEETRKAQAELLMAVSYQKIAERIKGYFD